MAAPAPVLRPSGPNLLTLCLFLLPWSRPVPAASYLECPLDFLLVSAKALSLSKQKKEKLLNYLSLPTLIILTKNRNGLNTGLSCWKCVCFHVPALSTPCCRERCPHILAQGLHAFGRSPAVLGLVVWLLPQLREGAPSVQSLAQAG